MHIPNELWYEMEPDLKNRVLEVRKRALAKSKSQGRPPSAPTSPKKEGGTIGPPLKSQLLPSQYPTVQHVDTQVQGVNQILSNLMNKDMEDYWDTDDE